jgi:hypothetical protein
MGSAVGDMTTCFLVRQGTWESGGGAHTPRSGVAFWTFFALPTGETQEGFPGHRHRETLHSHTTEAAAL